MINFQLKKLAAKSLAWSVKVIEMVFIGLFWLFIPIKSLFLFVADLFFKSIILPLFGRYLWLKNKFAKKASTAQDKVILIFTNRYLIHIIVAFIALSVVTSNLLAYEQKESYGQNALVYKIVGLEDEGVIQDNAPSNNESLVYRYGSENASLASERATPGQFLEEEIVQGQIEQDIAMTQGGSTLLKPDLASTEAAKVTRTSVKEYVVAENDTISTIAQKFNVSINTIIWANNLSFSAIIRPGQKLNIPPVSGVLHTIKKGDTIAKIAKSYDADASQIKKFNNLDDDASLAVGDTLMVPGGRIIYTQKPRTAVVYTTPAIDYTIPSTSSGGAMYWPSTCRRITQYSRGWRHPGVDIACAYGSAIRAAEGGVVTRVQYGRTGYGYNVTIDHGGGKKTHYSHLSRIDAVVGQEVAKGQVIGLEGSTGRSTGPHLDFEVIINGVKVNPLNYIR
ncbi:MAG: peptidoglycan DD-metalloendopeptidase family protein [Patescibacteria group bacterium]